MQRAGLLLLIIGVLASPLGPTPSSAEEAPRGTWQVFDADFSDIGHCLMTETTELTLILRPESDGTDGRFIESFKREGDSVSCPQLGSYRTTYRVKLSRISHSKPVYVATLTLADCQQRGQQLCSATEPTTYKRLNLRAPRRGIIFDGIFYDRINSPK